jgi:hypothetical protein
MRFSSAIDPDIGEFLVRSPGDDGVELGLASVDQRVTWTDDLASERRAVGPHIFRTAVLGRIVSTGDQNVRDPPPATSRGYPGIRAAGTCGYLALFGGRRSGLGVRHNGIPAARSHSPAHAAACAHTRTSAHHAAPAHPARRHAASSLSDGLAGDIALPILIFIAPGVRRSAASLTLWLLGRGVLSESRYSESESSTKEESRDSVHFEITSTVPLGRLPAIPRSH